MVNLLKDSMYMKFMMSASTCSLPSAGDHNNIILRVPRSNHKERGKFKDNVIKQKTFGEDEE